MSKPYKDEQEGLSRQRKQPLRKPLGGPGYRGWAVTSGCPVLKVGAVKPVGTSEVPAAVCDVLKQNCTMFRGATRGGEWGGGDRPGAA